MKYAHKLNIQADLPYLHKATVVLGKHGKGLNDHPEGVIRRYLPRKQIELVKQSLPKSIRDKVLGVNYTEVRLLAAHLHLVEQCVINFYQHTNGEVTKFFEGECIPDDDWSTDNGNGYLNVKMDQLIEIESFVAQDGDVWILNARKPHSVEKMHDEREHMHRFEPDGDKSRWIVQVYMDMPYEEVVQQFTN